MHVIDAMHTIATCCIRIAAMKNTCSWNILKNDSTAISSIDLRLAPGHLSHQFTLHFFQA